MKRKAITIGLGVALGVLALACPTELDIFVISLSVAPADPEYLEGDLFSLRATVEMTDGSTKDVTSEAQWVSADPGVAAVFEGLGTAVSAGTSKVTASITGAYGLGPSEVVSGSTNVTVLDIASVALTPSSARLEVGESTQLSLVATLTNGGTRDLTESADWRSVDPNIATVSMQDGSLGKVSAVSSGTSMVRATVAGQTAEATIDVVELTEIRVLPYPVFFNIGETAQFTATAVYSDGLERDVTGEVTWSSEDPNIASVSADGLVTAVAPGTIHISATLKGVTGSGITTVAGPQIPTEIDYYVPLNTGTSFGIAHIWWDETAGWGAEPQPLDVGSNAVVELEVAGSYLFGREGGPLATNVRVFLRDPGTGALQEEAGSPLTASQPGGSKFNIISGGANENALVDFTSNPPNVTGYPLSLDPAVLGGPVPVFNGFFATATTEVDNRVFGVGGASLRVAEGTWSGGFTMTELPGSPASTGAILGQDVVANQDCVFVPGFNGVASFQVNGLVPGPSIPGVYYPSAAWIGPNLLGVAEDGNSIDVYAVDDLCDAQFQWTVDTDISSITSLNAYMTGDQAFLAVQGTDANFPGVSFGQGIAFDLGVEFDRGQVVPLGVFAWEAKVAPRVSITLPKH
jgi:uncharacterized protein YjdB